MKPVRAALGWMGQVVGLLTLPLNTNCCSLLGKRDIQALGVNCGNVERGCKWQGTVSTCEKHLATCKFSLVLCPNDCKDSNLLRKDLLRHLERDCPNRDYECKHCGKKGTFAFIMKVHDPTCKKKMIPCPNAECTDTMRRQGIKRHLESCDYTEIPCKYLKLGCDVKMKRNARAHEDQDELHLDLALDKIVTLEEKMISMEKEMQENSLTNGKSLTFKLTEFQRRKDEKEVFCSPTFYTGPNGYHMKINVYANGNGNGEGTHVSVYARILEGKYDNALKWPFVGTVTCTLLNQLRNEDHIEEIIYFSEDQNVVVGSGWGCSMFIAHSKLEPALQDPPTQYLNLEEDTLYFRVSADVLNQKPWLEPGMHNSNHNFIDME